METCGIIRRMAPKEISVMEELSDEPLWVRGNKGMMSHLLLNLSTNAFHAMEGRKGVLTIRLFRMPQESQDLSGDVTGDMAVLSVSDTGCGISKEAQDKIFEPFYTTKRSGKGTGLGLSVVQTVMKAVNGRENI